MSEFDTLSFEELKSRYETAVAEKEKIDKDINEIRATIAKKLEDIEAIRDSIGVPTNPVSNTTSTIKNELDNLSDYITIDFRKIWNRFVAYIVPILIVVLLVFIASKYIHRTPKTTSFAPTSSEQVVAVANCSVGDLYDTIK